MANPQGWLGGYQAPRLQQGYTPSPYLSAQIGGLQGQFQQNLQRNTLPAIRSSAIMAGGYGGSKQGIAEGIAAGDAATGFQNAATGLLANDYEAQQGRDLSKYTADQGFLLGNRSADLGVLNSDRSYDLGKGQLDQARYATDVGAATSRYGTDASRDVGMASNATQRYGIDTTAGTQRYLGDQSAGTQRYGIDTTAGTARYLGDQSNATSRYGIDTSAGTARYGVDANTGVQNRNLDVTMRGQDISTGRNHNNYDQLQSERDAQFFYTVSSAARTCSSCKSARACTSRASMGRGGRCSGRRQRLQALCTPATARPRARTAKAAAGSGASVGPVRRLPACEELRMDLRSTR
jgi:hypothetical protein